jgi:hypothetical protein
MRAFLALCALALAVAAAGTGLAGAAADTEAPPPPQLPRNFHGTGTYVVKELDGEVPFTWDARGGNMQMTAGGPDDPIWFTNIIDDGTLYTLTYTWPGIERRPCSRIGPYTLAEFNQGLAQASYVGPEILLTPTRRNVQHFRASLAYDLPPELVPSLGGGVQARIPVMSGDFYVDRKDHTKFWQVLHFGLHNLYATDLDEWIVMDTFRRGAGTVELPEECTAQPESTTTTVTPTPTTIGA